MLVLSINCKDTFDHACPQTLFGMSEEILFKNAKYHALNTHGFTENSWEELMSNNLERFRKLISAIPMAPYENKSDINPND